MTVDKVELRRLAEDVPPGLRTFTAKLAEFHKKASPSAILSLLDENDKLRAEFAKLKSQLSESRANDRTAMGYLADLRQIAGGDDFSSLLRNVEAMRVNAERYEWLSNHQGLEYPEYVVTREYIVDPAAQGCFSTDYYSSKTQLDLAIDAAMSSAKEKGDD